MYIRFLQIETFPFGPKLDTINTDAKNELEFEYIKVARVVLKRNNLDIRSTDGPFAGQHPGIRSQDK